MNTFQSTEYNYGTFNPMRWSCCHSRTVFEKSHIFMLVLLMEVVEAMSIEISFVTIIMAREVVIYMYNKRKRRVSTRLLVKSFKNICGIGYYK